MDGTGVDTASGAEDSNHRRDFLLDSHFFSQDISFIVPSYCYLDVSTSLFI